MSAPSKRAPELIDHLAWLGYTQRDSEGLVVSAPALVGSQVIIDRARLPGLQQNFAEHVSTLHLDDSDTGDTAAGISELTRFFTEFLGWPADLLVGWDASRLLPESLSVSLTEFQETLRPTYALSVAQPKEGESPWLLLVQAHPPTTDLTRPVAAGERGWGASPAKKFERLLRETGVPIGLLTNGVSFQLIYAPPKENSGTITFPVGPMLEVSGRLILGAFHLLLDAHALFTAPTPQRLPSLLQTSRSYQATVSEKLAGQVLHALYELLRGFVAAERQAKSTILHDLATRRAEEVYGGLVTVLLRLVFVLFAEDRGLLPASALFVRHYSVRGLFERLRADAERHPDTMDHRYGAWAQLLALFRLIHGGCQHPEMKMPPREGHLFDPQRYPFLEGRAHRHNPIGAIPLVSDGVIHGILEKLCILDGERVSYRTLDVEEIGSVYQTIMGFGVEVVAGTAIALKGKGKKGSVPAAPVVVLDELLAQKSADRVKFLTEQADTKLTGEAEKALKAATSVDDLLAALNKRIDIQATPSPVAQGGLVLQPNDERRRSGSHYTPRSFTEPIVRKTLEPVLSRLLAPDLSIVPLDQSPTPTQILDLKIADIAVGSAAFLVEACRQLGDVLVKAWRVHGGRPHLPPDETEELLAMRLVAQRCLYGVDRNPMAVDLAKLSLWLATLAKDHPFTFLDHSIRCGDSVVGLTQKQIAAFTWDASVAGKQRILGQDRLERQIERATQMRREILEGGDYVIPALKAQLLRNADEALDGARFVGDLIIAAFFSADKDRARRESLEELRQRCVAWHTSKPFDPSLRPDDAVDALRSGPTPVAPFHWQIEFPEVFDRENGGFDVIVGNPPFAGKNTILAGNREGYVDWLKLLHEESHGNADLVAHFFRRAFTLLRRDGTFGLIATNTIRQGDTRQSGLRWICVRGGGTIFAARRRYKWVGAAAVIVSVVWIIKGTLTAPFDLDGKPVPVITAYLFHDGGHENPETLPSNANRSFQGPIPLGMGFTFDDSAGNGSATSLAEMHRLLKRSVRNGNCIFPYLGAEEFLEHPAQAHSRYIIYFGEMSEAEAREYPDLMQIVENKVRPDREKDNRETRKRYWWRFAELAPALSQAKAGKSRVLMHPFTATYVAFAFVPAQTIVSGPHNVFALESFAAFAVLQCRVHDLWTRFFGSSLEDRQRYTPSDCFETFPFPSEFETSPEFENVGREYYEYRASVMLLNDEGLTKTYNRFHNPDDTSPQIAKLRVLHAAMDRAVLDSYGWTDIPTDCEFLLDFEDDPDDDVEGKPSKRKKPWRYRWPDAVRDEVLARLLKLNAKRAAQEHLAGEGSAPKSAAKKSTRAKRGRKPKADSPGVAPAQRDLLPPAQGDLFDSTP